MRGITGELTKLKNCDYVRVTALSYVMIHESTKQKNVTLANFATIERVVHLITLNGVIFCFL